MNLDNIQITKDCIQQASGIGHNTFYNICNGAVKVVPWGAGDWAAYIFLGVFFLFLIGMFIKFLTV